MEKEEKNEKGKQSVTGSKTPALEWLVAIIGLILVVGTLGFLLYDALTENDTPPQIVVEAKDVIQTPNGFLVKFELENKGDNHASEVEIEGSLMQGEQEKQTSSVNIGYAPSHSKRKGGLFFTENPNNFKLELRALGYNEP